MPVDYQSVQMQIRQMGQRAGPRAAELKSRSDRALSRLAEIGGELDWLKRRVEMAEAANASLRCARPVTERMDTCKDFPALTCMYTLLAADGSQIVPSHHDAVEFGVINVGAVRFHPGQPVTPTQHVSTHLLCEDDLYSRDGHLLTEEVVALMRDVAERRTLALLAGDQPGQVVTLTDGQMEIFGASKDSPEFRRELQGYMDVMRELAVRGVVTAGYVAKPRSDLVARLLDLSLLEETELAQAGLKRQLIGVTDANLFATMLAPGQRSAVFAIQSKPSTLFSDELAPHFFYFNASVTGHQHMARVEFPQWVARDESLVDLLHFALVGQCREMGSRPYPYALHRAHEVALVSLEEKRHLEFMIAVELRRQGVDIGEISSKQSAKDLDKRGSYKA